MPDTTNSSSKKQILIVYFVLTFVILAVFWQVNRYDFIAVDDAVYVMQNNHVQAGFTAKELTWAFSTKDTGLWNPLVWLSFMLDYRLFDLTAGGYHLTNLILHKFHNELNDQNIKHIFFITIVPISRHIIDT